MYPDTLLTMGCKFTARYCLYLMQVCSLFVISVCAHYVYSNPAPPPPRWTLPCHGKSPNGQVVIPSATPALEDEPTVAYKLLLKSEDVIEVAGYLKEIYIIERIESTVLQRLLDANTTLTGFPDLSILRPDIRFGDRLLEDYRRVSTAAVFVEQIKADEGISRISPNHLMHVKNLESQIYPCLCQIHNAIYSRNSHIPSYVARDVMRMSDRVMTNNAQRYNRDYAALSNIVLLFRSIATGYFSLIN